MCEIELSDLPCFAKKDGILTNERNKERNMEKRKEKTSWKNKRKILLSEVANAYMPYNSAKR